MSLSLAAKVALPGIWTECDDAGVFEWKPLVIKARIFPADNVDVSAILSELEAANCLRVVEVDGRRYGLVRNFRRFQRPEKPKHRHPLPDEYRSYVGLAEINPQPVTDASGNGSRNPPQMEDGGWRMEDGDLQSKLIPSEKEEGMDLDACVNLWNAELQPLGISMVQHLSNARRKSLALRLGEIGGLAGWRSLIAKIRESPWLLGRNDRNWRVFFDWVLKPGNLTKIMEGNYDDHGSAGSRSALDLIGEAAHDLARRSAGARP